MGTYECPVDGPFEAEVHTRVSQASYDAAVIDERGQHPTMADQLSASGASLTRDQWDELVGRPNPSWEPTYNRVIVDDDPVEHQVAVCPTCGSPIKVG